MNYRITEAMIDYEKLCDQAKVQADYIGYKCLTYDELEVGMQVYTVIVTYDTRTDTYTPQIWSDVKCLGKWIYDGKMRWKYETPAHYQYNDDFIPVQHSEVHTGKESHPVHPSEVGTVKMVLLCTKK